MKIYKHYSFDLWLTLIKSNPIFKKERALFFHKYLNSSKKTLEEVEYIFRKVDLMSNLINQKTGGNIDAEEMYLMIVYELNDSSNTFINLNTEWVLYEMEQLFFQYMPQIYDCNTLTTLKKLKECHHASMSILSNTAFIKGSTIRIILEKLGINSLFDFQLYSDEVNMSKPNQKFFTLMMENIHLQRQGDNVTFDDIIHIGDNVLADINGAKQLGIHSFLINSNNKNITDLLK